MLPESVETTSPPQKTEVTPREFRATDSAEPGQPVGVEAHSRDQVGVLVLPLDGVLTLTHGPILGSQGDGEPKFFVNIASDQDSGGHIQKDAPGPLHKEEETWATTPPLFWKCKVNKGKQKVDESPSFKNLGASSRE